MNNNVTSGNLRFPHSSRFPPEGILFNTQENKRLLSDPRLLEYALAQRIVLEARALVCDSRHNIVVDLGCMKGIILRDEGAMGIGEGTVKDIALISRVGKPVCFVVNDITADPHGNRFALLSRREVQEQCFAEKISKLVPGDILDAKVTHLEPFGAFVDIGSGIASMIPIDAISVSRISHPKDRFCCGMDIRAVVRCVEGNKISLSHKELLGTWTENAARFRPGETVAGIVRSVEEYGIFIELAPNLSGLAEHRESIAVGSGASVFIKSIIPDRVKIKLVIVDTFDPPEQPCTPTYFYKGSHISRFVYSDAKTGKQIETVFDQS